MLKELITLIYILLNNFQEPTLMRLWSSQQPMEVSTLYLEQVGIMMDKTLVKGKASVD